MAEKDKLPTLGEKLSEWFGVQLPSIPLKQTLKNFDKALSKVVLAAGQNVEARLKRNTAVVEGATEKARAIDTIVVEGTFRTQEERRKVENRAYAVKAAQDDLESNPPSADASSEIDDDWLNLYARLAEDKSSPDLQRLFGKILSGEIRRPGSYSLRTLQIMATISKQDAERLSRVLSYALDGQAVPFETGARNSPTPAERLFLEELGLAGHPNQLGGMSIGITIFAGATHLMMASKFAIVIINNSQKEISYKVPSQQLTTHLGANSSRSQTHLRQMPSF